MTVAYNQPGYINPDTGLIQSENPFPPLVHGVVRSLSTPSMGTLTDNNTSNYLFAGTRHMSARFTDFDNASGATPAANTEAGWTALLDGLFPISSSTDFNPDAVACGATLELTGGVTASARWLRRQVTEAAALAFTNIRLRNFNIWKTEGYVPYVHLSFYNYGMTQPIGKITRTYYSGDPRGHDNVWAARTDGQYSAHCEPGTPALPQLDGDQTNASGWTRCDMFMDFENGVFSFYVDGLLQTDVSRGIDGIETDWIYPASILDYILLGNTISAGRTGAGTAEDPYVYNSEYTGWAMPVLSFSRKRIEIADSAVWASRTDSVIQPLKTCVSGDAEVIVNQGRFDDLVGKHYFELDGMTATYIGPVV